MWGLPLEPAVESMTIKDLEKKMEERFSTLEKRIIDESIETRRHFLARLEGR